MRRLLDELVRAFGGEPPLSLDGPYAWGLHPQDRMDCFQSFVVEVLKASRGGTHLGLPDDLIENLLALARASPLGELPDSNWADVDAVERDVCRIYDRIRHRMMRDEAKRKHSFALFGDEVIETPPDMVEFAEFAAEIQEFLASLPDRDREILEMSRDGYTAEMIALSISTSVRTVYRTLKSVQERLERVLRR